MYNEQIPYVTAFFKGGSAPKPPPPPKPVAPSAATESFAKSDLAMRQRKARGFSSSIIGGYSTRGSDRSTSILKDLLGE